MSAKSPEKSAKQIEFYFLSDIETNIRVTINSLQGIDPCKPRENGLSGLMKMAKRGSSMELLLECQLLVDGRTIAMPLHTRYRQFSASAGLPLTETNGASDSIEWTETLRFPVKYTDLSSTNWRSSVVVFRLWDLASSGEGEEEGNDRIESKQKQRQEVVARRRTRLRGCEWDDDGDDDDYSEDDVEDFSNYTNQGGWRNSIGGTTGKKGNLIGEGEMRLISDQRLLETGVRHVVLNPPGSTAPSPPIPGRSYGSRDVPTVQSSLPRSISAQHQAHHARHMSGVTQAATKGMEMKWLDKLESYRLQSIKKPPPSTAPFSTKSVAQLLSRRSLQGRANGNIRQPLVLTVTLPKFRYPVVAWQGSTADNQSSKLLQRQLQQQRKMILPIDHTDRLLVLHDPGMGKPNPVELKFQKLAKNFGQSAWLQVKPNGRERAALRRIIGTPLHMKEMKAHDRELLWKFRYRLTTMKNTITRFLRCVEFNDPDEREEALKMLPLWEKENTVTSEDALELLSEDFLNPDVREFAVKQLDKETNQEIEKYLMLLVQALQYESKYPSPLSSFICKRSSQKLAMANAVNWYLTVEAAESPKMYSAVLKEFRSNYLGQTEEGKQWKADIELQMEMVEGIRSLCRMVSAKGGKQSRRIEILRSSLQKRGKFAHLTNFKRPVRFPLDPSVLITGLVPEKSTVFASNAFPVLLAFQRHESEELVRVIFKDGDDLRQDQLIMQLVKLMDSRLKKRGLDLEIISFDVQGWSASDGVVEFVPGCSTVASVIDEWKEISKFLHEHNPKAKLIKNALSNWVRSSAGYSVLTYILAIGDRHLDNILLTKDGHMLHIDFGYIFGRDPKPFPPKVKFTKDMMDAMGGAEFEEQFYEKSCLSYNLLRRDACLILNLIYLTGDWAGNKKDNLTCVRSRLALELNDDQAAKDYKQMVHKVMHSNFEAFKDGIHTIATNLKK